MQFSRANSCAEVERRTIYCSSMKSRTETGDTLAQVPEALRIRVICDTSDFVVIEKPCHLRSVPGHASPPASRKRKQPGSEKTSSERRTAQEAWVLAIQSFLQDEASSPEGSESKEDIAERCIAILSKFDAGALASIPRKLKVFQRYLERNQKKFSQQVKWNQRISTLLRLQQQYMNE